MSPTLITFRHDLFYNAMVNLVGRAPDTRRDNSLDGRYTYCYKPKNAKEEELFALAVDTLQAWLGLFELIPFRSRCEYGRLPHPTKGEDGQDYLEIVIVHPMPKTGDKR